jgi:diguanylate cyclase (GGDEF)-like protein
MPRTYSIARFVAPALLVIHLGIRLVSTTPNPSADLFLFNLVGFSAAATAALAPLFNDRLARYAIASAIALWTVGSTFSSWDSFHSFQIWSPAIDICYSLFYPTALFGMIRALTTKRRVTPVELLDIAIITLGLSSVIASVALKPALIQFDGSAFSVFLSIIYPAGDVMLLAMGGAIIFMNRSSMRGNILLAGISAFAITDFYFLWISATSGYVFGSISDDGWMLGLVLMSQSLWCRGREAKSIERLNSIATTLSLILSSTILAFAALRPGYFPRFALVPAFATVTFSFIRMAIALHDARSGFAERELARTDELTGLPNRRRFLAELEKLSQQRGSLLLLDLNGFKAINDNYGHAVGDQLLQTIATRFSRAAGESSMVARLGGDEFGLITFASESHAHEIALALHAALSYPVSLAHIVVDVGVSIGHALCDGSAISPVSKEDLLRRADSAMYEAKRSGRGTVQWAAIS